MATNTALSGARLLCCNKGHFRLFGFSSVHQKAWTSVADARPRGFRMPLLWAWPLTPGGAPIPTAAAPVRQNIPALAALRLAIPSSAWRLALSTLTLPLYWASELGLPSSPGVARPSALTRCRCVTHALLSSPWPSALMGIGGSLQSYRYAIVAGQRLNWCMRGQLGPAWELVSRWERLQPVRHRTPVPEVILKSLVVLAWLKGFRRWAACTLLAYFGLARIGEVLRATRLHLLLPEDHCSVLTGCVS